MTVISITEFFKTGKGVDLEVITSATLSKLEEIKEKTASGNALLISHHSHREMVILERVCQEPSVILSLCLYLNSGLSHIIETRKVLDLRIDLKPSYLLLPKSGFYDGKSDLMIVDFGYLQVREGSKTIFKR